MTTISDPGYPAVYVDSKNFTLSGSMVSEFVSGQRVAMDCGADGMKFGVVSGATYNAGTGRTQVTITQSNVTSNLVQIWISWVTPGPTGNLATHDHSDEDYGGLVDHGSLQGVGANDHHPQLHAIDSHTDTSATGSQLNTLVGGGNANTLHIHDRSGLTGTLEYFGDPTADGCYKLEVDGGDLVFSRRESGAWVEKSRIEA